ncbi:hypothetical protein [Bdellovibrio sp. HCB337]|uniref:hypothetical protein n=1 Tax=Bdellovibrio sp. HCB337 TaxID=3394358 RepID=UPI0039A59B74
MKKNKFLVLLSGLLIAGVAGAIAATYSDKGESSISVTDTNGDVAVKMLETRYITQYLGQYGKQVLLKVQTSTEYWSDREGLASQSVIEARSQKDGFKNVLWKSTDEGAKADYVNEEFVATTKYGCCGDFDRHTLYNIETGVSPATYLNTDFYVISVPNSDLTYRYLAQIEDKTAPASKNGQDYIGAVGYFDSAGRITKVRFYTKVTPGWGTQIDSVKVLNLAGGSSKNALRGNELELWDSDGVKVAAQAYQGFGISGEIHFDNKDLKFTVAVKGDQIDASNVEVSPELAFEVVP